MMRNEIIAISNSAGALSGTGRRQALKDGSFAGLCPFTDDPEPRQKDFLSILSRLGAGTVQVTPEEPSNANPKLAEGRLQDEGNADIVLAGKPKGKQGKGGCAVNHLTTAYPDTLGLVMGLLSIPDPQQPDLSTDPTFYAPGAENEEKVASGLAAGELLPETTATRGLSGGPNLLPGNLSMTTVPEDAGRDSAVPAEIVSKIQVKGNPVVAMVPKADPPHTGRVRTVAVEGLANNPEQQPEPSSASEAVPTEAGQTRTAGVKVSRLFQGRQQPDAETISGLERVPKTDPPRTGRVRTAAVEELVNTPEQRPESSSVPEPAPSEAGQTRTVGVKVTQMFQGRQQPDAATVSELGMVPKTDPPRTGRVRTAAVEELVNNPEQRPESSSVTAPVSSEAGQPRTVGVKVTQTFQGRQQSDAETVSELEMVPKSDLSSRDRVHPVLAEGTARLHRPQERDSLVIPDTVNLNPVAEKSNPGVMGDQAEKLSSAKPMDATVRENAPIDQKHDTGVRHQGVKGESASFLSPKDSVETGGIAAASAGGSNPDNNDTSNMFMAANPSGKIAGGEADASFKAAKPESGDMTVNFSREGQMEKISVANPFPNESLPEGRSFHAEVLKQVVEKTSANLKSGQSEIRIDLKPESLGHLRLHVSTDHQQVTVKILAENTQVKEMIENQASLIKNELQHQGIHVTSVKVDMLMSGGSDFAYSQREGTAMKQARHEPAYGSGKDHIAGSALKEPDSLDRVHHRGGSIVNYFA
jgi:flagellar hook-length control protein FliK